MMSDGLEQSRLSGERIKCLGNVESALRVRKNASVNKSLSKARGYLRLDRQLVWNFQRWYDKLRCVGN